MSLQAAREGMVLLKNDNNALPFARGKSIAVIGPNANSSANLLGNCTCVVPLVPLVVWLCQFTVLQRLFVAADLGQICKAGITNYDCVQTVYGAIDVSTHTRTCSPMCCSLVLDRPCLSASGCKLGR